MSQLDFFLAEDQLIPCPALICDVERPANPLPACALKIALARLGR
jgi:hypothetical protein